MDSPVNFRHKKSAYSMLHWQLCALNCCLESVRPVWLGVGNENPGCQLPAIVENLNWCFIGGPVTIFNAGASCTKKPAPSFILTDVLSIARKSYWYSLDYRIDISAFMNFSFYTQICCHVQCPRALSRLIDDYPNKCVNTPFCPIFKGFFSFLYVFFPLHAAQLLDRFSTRFYTACMAIYFYFIRRVIRCLYHAF